MAGSQLPEFADNGRLFRVDHVQITFEIGDREIALRKPLQEFGNSFNSDFLPVRKRAKVLDRAFLVRVSKNLNQICGVVQGRDIAINVEN